MSRSKVELDRIAVASPCPVSWNDMAGDDRVRFCNQCNLNVYNLSAMTKAEAESVITNTEGRGLKFEEEVALNLNVKLSVGALEMVGILVTTDTVPTIDNIEWLELKRNERPRE